jgi:NAD(P)H-flavin reductase
MKLDVQVPNTFACEDAQYIQMNCGKYSILQWHPFYVFPSSVENCISIIVVKQGGWTREMIEYTKTDTPMFKFPKIILHGPFGREKFPRYYQYPEVVFIANDHYIAPFIPIIARILATRPNSKIKIIWVH